MPDFKCAVCAIRVRTAEPGPDCPVCEGSLEPVAELSELVGLRLIQPGGVPFDRQPAELLAGAVSAMRERLDLP
jgi:hypothetical protein